VIAADTKVIVRLLTGDDPRQAAQARHLFETDTIFVPKTVLLETEWVLRRVYEVEGLAVNKALDDLLSLPNARAEDEPLLRQALAWNRAGMDFADALHLASSRRSSRVATFDQRMIKSAATTGLGRITTLICRNQTVVLSGICDRKQLARQGRPALSRPA
jgi:predicted nucleic-acid-binding protein